MKQTREIKHFIFSQYFADGLRISFGVLIPAMLFARFGDLQMGITFSLGALTVSIADSPGPVVHKRNGMLFCILFMAFTGLLTGLINRHPVLLVSEIALLCFFFSMFNVYGTRAASIGTAALLIMVLNLDDQLPLYDMLRHVGIILLGGSWYMVFSLSLGQIRPYRLAQQSLAESIREVAQYLRIKADFYNTESDADENYKKLIDQQIIVHEHQDNVRELLFKSRLLVKDSTSTGRQLVLVFVDVVDLFEQSMATHYDYRAIRQNFGETGVLDAFRDTILKIADELENLGYYINSNEDPVLLHNFQSDLERLKTRIDLVESEHRTNNLVLKKILVNIRNIVNRIQKVHSYFNPVQLAKAQIRSEVDLPRFVTHQDFDLKLFIDNLGLESSIFRHSLRVAIVAVLGYLASLFFPLGNHSYWILLTIIVILKPGFSLTKKRNYQRLIGTIAGAVIGVGILYFFRDSTARFVFLLVLMIGAYSFARLNYVVSVLFMTPYILIMFSFMGAGSISIAQERIFDTLVGSIIAFAASYVLFPNWEFYQINGFMRSLLIANYNYLLKAAEALQGKNIDITDYKLARRDVYVSSANMGSAFQRMLSEPKSKQKNTKDIHKFVVLNHMLSSYAANLIFHLRQSENRVANNDQLKLIRRSLASLAAGIDRLKSAQSEPFTEVPIQVADAARIPGDESLDTKLITEQLDFVNNAAQDILKIAEKVGSGD